MYRMAALSWACTLLVLSSWDTERLRNFLKVTQPGQKPSLTCSFLSVCLPHEDICLDHIWSLGLGWGQCLVHTLNEPGILHQLVGKSVLSSRGPRQLFLSLFLFLLSFLFGTRD